jgi:proteasome lid subunit RPN8/RPN11
MGILWRTFAPRPAKRLRRSVRHATHPVSYLTPSPVKSVRRAAYYTTHPWEYAERGVEDAVVAGLRGSGARTATGRRAAPIYESGYLDDLEIADVALDAVIAHARTDAPNLCCGYLGARDGRILRVIKIPNVAADPRNFWQIDHADDASAIGELEESNCEWAAVYHSLPTARQAWPTPLDIERWQLNVPYVIISLGGSHAEVRAFDIVRSALAELRVVTTHLDPGELEASQQPVQGYPELDLFLAAEANDGTLRLSVRELCARFAGLYDDLAELNELLDESGFDVHPSLDSASRDDIVELKVAEPPITFELRAQVDQAAATGSKPVTASVAELLNAVDRKRLTDKARDDIREALDEVELASEPDLSSVAIDDTVTLMRHSAA